MTTWRRIAGRFRMKHVNHQIFVLMIVTITIPLLLISGLIYYFSVQAMKNEYQNSSNLILNNLSFNIDQYLQSIEKGTLNAQMDSGFQAALEQWSLSGGEPSEDEKIKTRSVVEHFISTIEMTIKNVDSVQVYSGDRVFYSLNFNRSDYDDSRDFTREAWYLKTLERQGSVVIIGTHRPFRRVKSTEMVISIARVINKVGSKQPLGVMLIDIRLDSLSEILKLSENSSRNFLIVDDRGGVIYSSKRRTAEPEAEGGASAGADIPFHADSAPLKTVLQGENGSFYAPLAGASSFVNFVTSPYSGWKVIQYIGEKEMTKHADWLRQIILALAFCSLGTAVLFMFILSVRVTRPIIMLSRQVKQVGMGKFDISLSSDRQDEFGVLYQGVRKMVEDLQSYLERTAIAKTQQKVAQYGALKSQINPHFLANALETIQMKAVLSGQRDIGEMVGILGRLFRIQIQTGTETVPLQAELEHTRLYVKVQQMRFGDKIRYTERLASGSEAVRVMHFSLQPLVENAIVHGLERRSGPGTLEVSAVMAGDDMLIKVRDDGAGMDEARLQELRNRLALPSDTLDEEHIGIKNVHDRIQFYFGEKYGLELDSRLGQGTVVTIRVPAGN